MPIDWDEVERTADQKVQDAVSRTDAALAGKVSSLTTMKDEEIQALLPEPGDVKKLAELMKIVDSATARNEKVVALERKFRELGGVVVALLEKLV